MWITISERGVSELFFLVKKASLNGATYREECIEGRLLPFLEKYHSDREFFSGQTLLYSICRFCTRDSNPPNPPQILPIFWLFWRPRFMREVGKQHLPDAEKKNTKNSQQSGSIPLPDPLQGPQDKDPDG